MIKYSQLAFYDKFLISLDLVVLGLEKFLEEPTIMALWEAPTAFWS